MVWHCNIAHDTRFCFQYVVAFCGQLLLSKEVAISGITVSAIEYTFKFSSNPKRWAWKAWFQFGIIEARDITKDKHASHESVSQMQVKLGFVKRLKLEKARG